MDEFVTCGYCRQLDDTRMVLCERDDGDWEADCAFPGCPYAAECQIALEIKNRCRPD